VAVEAGFLRARPPRVPRRVRFFFGAASSPSVASATASATATSSGSGSASNSSSSSGSAAAAGFRFSAGVRPGEAAGVVFLAEAARVGFSASASKVIGVSGFAPSAIVA
jgi:hypothetical protein